MTRNRSFWLYYYPALNLFRLYLSVSNVSEYVEMSFVLQKKSFAVQLEWTEKKSILFQTYWDWFLIKPCVSTRISQTEIQALRNNWENISAPRYINSFFKCTELGWSHDSTVGIVTGYRLGGQSWNPIRGNIFLFSTASRLALGTTSWLIVNGRFFSG
jgi:hypothetical protein